MTASKKKMNIILIYDETEENILMCYRVKNPYRGLYNLVGGKVEDGEDNLLAAYRDESHRTSSLRWKTE